MTPLMIGIWIVLIVGLTGVLLLVMGWRGRAVDDHPVCRKCRFDLTGVYPGAAACPECGADLEAASAVRIGNRRPRPLLTLGGVLTLTTVVLAVWIAWGSIGPAAWQQLKPVWWLRVEAANHGSVSSVAALDELMWRIKTNTIARRHIGKVVDDALAVQADDTVPWEPKWGELIETARAWLQLSDAQWDAYLSTAAEKAFELELRPRIRADDPLPYRLVQNPARVGEADLAVHIYFSGLWFGDQGVGGQSYVGAVLSATTVDYFHRAITSISPYWPGPGVYELLVVLDVGVYTKRTINPTITRFQTTFKRRLEVVGADAFSARPVHDPVLEQAVRNALHLEPIVNDRMSAGMSQVTGEITIHQTPVDLAFDVIVRRGDREWYLGSIFRSVGQGMTRHDYGNIIYDFDATHVDLILRPSRDVAVITVDIFEYWGSEIVFEDVKLQQR